MTVLERLYASGGPEVIIYTLELSCVSWPAPIRVCQGFDDVTAVTETGETVTFIAAGIDVALPKRDASGNQSLTFAIDNVTGEAQELIDLSIDAFTLVTLVMRSYVSTDLTAPAENPFVATVLNASMEGPTLKVEAGFFDMINRAWPRKLYTVAFAPGLTYLS